MSIKRGSQAVLQTLILSTFCCLLLPVCTQGSITISADVIVKSTSTATVNNSIPINTLTQGGNYSMSTSISSGKINTFNVSLISATATLMPPSQTTPAKIVSTARPESNKGTGREFDGLSFFGGMILGATICVVLFFALKYYRAKKRSYHSL